MFYKKRYASIHVMHTKFPRNLNTQTKQLDTRNRPCARATLYQSELCIYIIPTKSAGAQSNMRVPRFSSLLPNYLYTLASVPCIQTTLERPPAGPGERAYLGVFASKWTESIFYGAGSRHILARPGDSRRAHLDRELYTRAGEEPNKDFGKDVLMRGAALLSVCVRIQILRFSRVLFFRTPGRGLYSRSCLGAAALVYSEFAGKKDCCEDE